MRFFTCRFIRTAGKRTRNLKVTNFMNNLKNIEFLTFLYMFRSFRQGFITVSAENYRGMAHIMEKKQWKRQVVYYDINFAYLFLLLVGISFFCCPSSLYIWQFSTFCYLQATRNWMIMVSLYLFSLFIHVYIFLV